VKLIEKINKRVTIEKNTMPAGVNPDNKTFNSNVLLSALVKNSFLMNVLG